MTLYVESEQPDGTSTLVMVVMAVMMTRGNNRGDQMTAELILVIVFVAKIWSREVNVKVVFLTEVTLSFMCHRPT